MRRVVKFEPTNHRMASCFRWHIAACLLFQLFTRYTAYAQALNPLHIPDTLQGPVFNLSIGQSNRAFFPGNTTQTLAYNGHSYLGPTLILRRGWQVQATIQNNLADTTTLHWHGLHVSAHTDGGPHSPILPGQQWNPHFTCLDKASTYWYHPHFHGKTARQTMQGAAGLIIVRDGEEAALDLPRRYGVDDFPLIVQSLEFDTTNQINPKSLRDSVVLVNGTHRPYLEVPGQWTRLRLLNASNARNFNLGLSGNQSFQLIGTDGGLLGKPLSVSRVRLAPGERAEVLINFEPYVGQSLSFKSYGSEIPVGTQGGPLGAVPAGTPSMQSSLNGTDFEVIEFRVQPQTSHPVVAIPDSLAAQTRLAESSATGFRNIRFSPVVPGSVIGPFLINDSSFNMQRIDFQIPVNSVEIWTIQNQTVVAHPFHLHGFSFYIIDRYGAPVEPQEQGRRDMVLVSPNEELRIIVKFTEFADSTMPYMFHCHLLTHEDEGMMGQFVVKPLPTETAKMQAASFFSFPNPFQNQVRLDGIGQHEPWAIFDAFGKSIVSGKGPASIAAYEWPVGLYILRSNIKTIKLLKISH